jgi:hypothetical protein
MVKKYLLSLVAALAFLPSQAQIMLTPIVDSTIGGLTENNVTIAENRLRNVISSMGMESGYGGRFVMAIKVSALQREVSGTKLIQHLEITFAVGDNQSNICFGSTSMEAIGIGNTEGQAMTSALKNIKATPKLKDIIAEAKTRIIEYYESNCGNIMQKAKGYSTNQSWEQALFELSAIPQEVSCYPDALNMMEKIYVAHMNHDAQQVLNEAQAIWAADPNPGWGAEEAMRILSGINTSAKCYPQAQALMRKIESRVKGVTDRRYNDAVAMEKARLNASVALQKARIRACRDVGVAWAKRRTTVVVNRYYRSWW